METDAEEKFLGDWREGGAVEQDEGEEEDDEEKDEEKAKEE
jgi:hypothetical protein